MTESVVLHLNSTDAVRRAWRRAALRYSARKCREWGHMASALELERYADFLAEPQSPMVAENFEIDTDPDLDDLGEMP